VTFGNLLTPAGTQHKPHVSFALSEEDPDALYTLVLTDPDAPTRGDKKWSEYAHYVASGIKIGIAPQEPFVVNNSHDILSYVGPAPPPKTGKHRYVFLLYKQKPGVTPKIFDGERPTWGSGVPGSGAKEWAAKNQLTLLAANFYLAQNTEQ
jgi:phosphatidylethanolamine-binding protein